MESNKLEEWIKKNRFDYQSYESQMNELRELFKIEVIENPIRMNLRESQAWQLGCDKGFKAGVESEREKK